MRQLDGDDNIRGAADTGGEIEFSTVELPPADFLYDTTTTHVIRAVLVVVLVLVTGCDGTSGPAGTLEPTPEPIETFTPTPTPTPTTTPPPENPYEADPIVVAIDNPTNQSYKPLVREAIDYWQTNASQHTEYNANYSIQPNASNPDLDIRFVSEIYVCGQEADTDILGCAPYPQDITPYGREKVRIEFGESGTTYDNESLLETIKHEFGHLYGIDHGEGPMPLMSESAVANLTAAPNATERAIPWQYDTLQIYVDSDSFASSIQLEIDRQTNNTLAWVNNGKGSIPDDVTIKRTQDRSEADIVVTSGSVREEYLSTMESRYGRDTDADGALEYYTNATIVIDPNVEADHFGWHLGYHLESVLNPDERSEPFVDPEGGDRRDWWESY